MSLFFATFLCGCVLLALGALFMWNGPAVRRQAFALLRSRTATVVLFGSASLWFLWHILHLGQADFGDYSHWLFLGFAGVALASFYWVPDFLAVRGLAALMLLTAKPLLDAAYMHYEYPQRLLLVGFVYAAIVAAMYLGAVPYRLRDFFEWLYAGVGRPRVAGAILGVYGLVLTLTAFTY